MIYDAFILSLAIAGIVGVLVYSYKMAHSRVYPIGIVRKPAATRKSVYDAIADLQLRRYEDVRAVEGIQSLHTYRLLFKEAVQAKGTHAAPGKSSWQSIAVALSDRVLLDTDIDIFFAPRKKSGRSEELAKEGAGRSAIEEAVGEHAKALEFHQRLFQHLEERIRELELESLRKLENVGEEKPHTARTDLIH